MIRLMVRSTTLLVLAALGLGAGAAESPTAGFGLGGGGSSFKVPEFMTYDKLVWNEQGLRVEGNVEIKDSMFNLKGANSIQFDEKKGQLIATGPALEIDIPENKIKARARKLVYYAEERKTVLDGDAFIQQTTDDQRIESRGDIITITQSEDGKTGMTSESRPGSTRRPETKAFPLRPAEPKAQTAAPAAPKRVGGDINLIRLPQSDSGR